MISTFCKPRLTFIFPLLLLVTAVPARADNALFPLPDELRPDVDFWVSIFTKYSTDEGILHDNRHLGVVYEVLPMPASTPRRQRQGAVNARRAHYRAILERLASGKRSGLSDEEQRVLALWPADVSNATLAAAAGQIRYQHGLSDRFREGLVRAGRWRAHVHNAFARLGVPLELSALPHVESSYNPAARSHVGASGIWQFTRGTGRRFMRVDHVLDERNDPYAATVAAGELLAYNYSILGNWPMAITAYNHGLSGARRAMREFGDTNYVEILRNYRGRTFGFASRNFYVAFLAALHVDQNAETYFPGVTPEQPLDYQVEALPGYVPADVLAAAIGISERELAAHNPAAQATIWTGNKHFPRGYEIRVPTASLGAPLQQLLGNIAADQWQAEQLPDMYHRVARGDTLSQIAQTYKTSVSTLVALNQLGSRHRIRVGQQLRLPAAGPLPAVAAASPPPPPAAEVAAVADAEAAVDSEQLLSDSGALPDEVDEASGEMMAALRTSLLSDPSDYSVADDGSIEVHPLETLGHYADWLEIRTQRLRDINRLAFRTPVEVGRRLKLDFSTVDAATFELRRTNYQREQQDTFFREHTIRGVTEHVVQRGESVWVLALRQYKVPLWLFRQYNPQLDMHTVLPGTRIRLPLLQDIET